MNTALLGVACPKSATTGTASVACNGGHAGAVGEERSRTRIGLGIRGVAITWREMESEDARSYARSHREGKTWVRQLCATDGAGGEHCVVRDAG
jgi:hypothetical protein